MTTETTKRPRPTNATVKVALRKARAILKDHPKTPNTELAKLVGISAATLGRKLKRRVSGGRGPAKSRTAAISPGSDHLEELVHAFVQAKKNLTEYLTLIGL